MPRDNFWTRKNRRNDRHFGCERLEPRQLLTGAPVISEFMAANDGVNLDEDGQSSDWIEILNAGDESVDLAGWYLTDSMTSPKKWQIPSVELSPGETTVIFASNKDRQIPNQELHTNFKLASAGEYLALVRPDGVSVASEFSPSYPPQVENVSYGVPVTSTEHDLVSVGASGRVHVPTNDSLDPSNESTIGTWLDPSFNDGAWPVATTGIGYEVGDRPQVQLADSSADWTISGNQGDNNWSYGYYNRSTDGNSTFDRNDFRAFPSNYFAGVVWDWPDGNPPNTLIGKQNMTPNGLNSGDEHWAIRRYESESSGVLSIEWTIAKNNLARGGNGVTGRVFHNGAEVDSVVIDGSDNVGSRRQTVVTGVQVGDVIDFAVDPTGTDGQADDTLDNVRMTATVKGITGIGVNISEAGDLESTMHGNSSSAYIRIPFEVENPSQFDSMNLGMNYDDGFAAYINGFPIASANVDDSNLAFNSTAVTGRSVGETSQREEYDISDSLHLLNTGTNFLMIHGLNVDAADDDFLILPELSAKSLNADVDTNRYFVEATPGQLNGIGSVDAGPLFINQNYTSSAEIQRMPLSGEDIVVTVQLAETFHPLANAELHYRVMYGAERTISLADNGLANDELAGDGIFTATIPRRNVRAGQMVRWYMTATDTASNQTRYPIFDRPTDSAEYFGTVIYDDSVESSKLPIFHWFAQRPSRANTTNGTRSSLFFDGEFYDNVRFDIHGQSTRGSRFLKKSYDVDFNRDHRFRWNDDVRRMKDINLLTNYADKGKFRNTLAYETWALATGGRAHLAEPVRVQQNGEFFAIYDFVEDGDDRFLERLGLDPDGALYKGYNSLSSASGNQKITRKHEDFSDLQELIDGSRLGRDARKDYLFDNVDLPGAINFLASMVPTANIDCCHKNYYVYRDSDGTGEWTFLPWDVDLSYGRLWTRANNYFDDVIFVETGIPAAANNTVTGALLSVPEIREMYFGRLKTLVDTFLQPEETPMEERYIERRLDEILNLLDPTDDNPATGTDDYDLDFQKWGTWGNNFTMRDEIESVKNVYLPARRDYIFNTQTVGNGGAIPGEIAFAFETIVGENAPVSALVPRNGTLGNTWRDIGFDDSDWLHGVSGVGYERTNGYQDFIGIDLLSSDIPAAQRIDRDGNNRNENDSVYTRYEFELSEIKEYDNLTLQLRIDDGFVAFLNGEEIARRNFTGNPTWNSRADGNGTEATRSFSEFDITDHVGKLRVGDNVLAIQGLNQSVSSSDMIIQPKLLGGMESEGIASIEIGRIDFNPRGGNQDQEYVEFVNNGNLAVDISDWRIEGAIEHTFASGTVIPSNSSMYVTPDVVAFRGRSTGPSGGQGLFVQGGYKGHLSNHGETIQLFRSDGSFVTELTYEGEPSVLQDHLRVSEIMYSPQAPTPSELAVDAAFTGNDFEFVEVVNTSESDTLDLTGVRFTDGIEFDFTDSNVTSLRPNQRALIVSDVAAFEARYGTDQSTNIAGAFAGFSRLRDGGETIKLEDPTNSSIVEFTYDNNPNNGWPERANGRGSSLEIIDLDLDPNDASSWRPSSRIGGSPGFTTETAGPILVINEVLTHTDLPQVDSIELYNGSGETIELSNYFLSDSAATLDSLAKFQLPNTIVNSGDYIVFDENDFNATAGQQENDFALDGARGDEVYLTMGNGSPEFFVDSVSFGAARNGESFGRFPNTNGELAPMKSVTLAAPNAGVRVGPLIISEVNYNPAEPTIDALAVYPQLDSDDLEFVEIYNSSNSRVDLTEWRIRSGIDFDFDDETTIDANESLTIISFNPEKTANANRVAAFRRHYAIDENVPIVGGYSGKLDNGGELVRLLRPDEPPVDDPTFIPRLLEDAVRYDDELDWPQAADGDGKSLSRLSVDAYGNLPSSWIASSPTPGSVEFSAIDADFNDDGTVDVMDVDLLSAAIVLQDSQFDISGDGLATDEDLRIIIQQVLGTNFGDANLDGIFDSTDLILVFTAGQYEDGINRNSTWQTGDWNGDLEFDSGDMIAAFKGGAFVSTARRPF